MGRARVEAQQGWSPVSKMLADDAHTEAPSPDTANTDVVGPIDLVCACDAH